MFAIEIDSLKFGYKPDQSIIDIGSFQLEPNQNLFIHGPSGAGKTTLLSILCGIQSGYLGSVKIFDQELKNLKSSERDAFRASNIGYIFQQFNLVSYLSVRENIMLPLCFGSNRALEDRAPERLQMLAHALEINTLLDRNVNQLSIGQQQRVAAARALISSPKILIADEPTSALDDLNKTKFMELLKDSAAESKTTIVIVSHDTSLQKNFDQSLSIAHGGT